MCTPIDVNSESVDSSLEEMLICRSHVDVYIEKSLDEMLTDKKYRLILGRYQYSRIVNR